MRALPAPIAAAACALLCAACGQAAAHPAHHGPRSMAAVSLAGRRSPQITGGTPAQRTLLRQVVRAQATSQIVKLTIAPASPSWQPQRPGDVQLTAELAGAGKRARENTLGEWETWMVGGAFRDRSAALGLPRVIVVGDNEGAERADGPHPAHRTASGVPGFRRRVAAVAARSGARVIAVRVGDPDGYSAIVALQVADPAAFLQHDLGPLEHTAAGPACGRHLHRPLRALRARALLRGRVAAALERPRRPGRSPLRKLHPESDDRPLSLAPPLPCPSDRRPPPSTPPKPPQITGEESGGSARPARATRPGPPCPIGRAPPAGSGSCS